MSKVLQISNLHVAIDGKEILKGSTSPSARAKCMP